MLWTMTLGLIVPMNWVVKQGQCLGSGIANFVSDADQSGGVDSVRHLEPTILIPPFHCLEEV